MWGDADWPQQYSPVSTIEVGGFRYWAPVYGESRRLTHSWMDPIKLNGIWHIAAEIPAAAGKSALDLFTFQFHFRLNQLGRYVVQIVRPLWDHTR